jgi:hypothetical protein
MHQGEISQQKEGPPLTQLVWVMLLQWSLSSAGEFIPQENVSHSWAFNIVSFDGRDVFILVCGPST